MEKYNVRVQRWRLAATTEEAETQAKDLSKRRHFTFRTFDAYLWLSLQMLRLQSLLSHLRAQGRRIGSVKRRIACELFDFDP